MACPAWQAVLLQGLLLLVGMVGFAGTFLEIWGSTSLSTVTPVIADDHHDWQEVEPAFDRCVIMLVDALRFDMVLEGAMPLTRQVAAHEHTRLYRAIARTPTVTMPRLKALTTGRMPKFIDVFHNFGSSAVIDDNIIQQMKLHSQHTGGRNVLYGDNTWIKLFPDGFFRSDGTTSFFTKDFTEVDDNITRHLKEEFDPTLSHPKSRDWELVVLHYLGLDHIGHQLGSSGQRMKDKQAEMDSIFNSIHDALTAQDAVRANASDTDGQRRSLLILMSDHGMTDAGTHGGASLPESSAVLLFAPTIPMEIDDNSHGNGTMTGSAIDIETVQQVDFTPTFATQLGIDIPRRSLGRIIATAIPQRSQRVLALRQNAQQMMSENMRVVCPGTATALLEHGVNIDDSDLRTAGQGDAYDCARVMQEFVLAENLFVQLSSTGDRSELIQIDEERRCQAAYDSFLVSAQTMVAGESGRSESTAVELPFLIIVLMTAVIGTVSFLYNERPGLKWSAFGTAALFLIASALTGSSFIENEHCIHFFFMSTWCVLRLRDSLLGERPDAPANPQNCSSSKFWRAATWVTILCSLRILRQNLWIINFPKLNHVKEPSLIPGTSVRTVSADNANGDTATFVLSFVLALALLVLPRFGSRRKDGSGRVFGLGGITKWTALIVGAVSCVLFKMSTAEWPVAVWVATEVLDPITLPRLVYGCCAVSLVLSFFTGSNGKFRARPQLPDSLFASALLLATLLLRPVRLPALLLTAAVLQAIGREDLCRNAHSGRRLSFFPYFWLGKCLFFAQGNSHLISTVDVSPANIGLTAYDPIICGALLVFATFCGPILGILAFYGSQARLRLRRKISVNERQNDDSWGLGLEVVLFGVFLVLDPRFLTHALCARYWACTP